jgi:hypothetical protein
MSLGPYRDTLEWVRHQEELALLQLEIAVAREYGSGTPHDPHHLAKSLEDPIARRRALHELRHPSDATTADLVYELEQLRTLVETRTRQTNPEPPLDWLGARLSLSALEVDILRLVWLIETSPTAMTLARTLGLEARDTHIGLDLVTRVLGVRTAERIAVRKALDEQSTLVRTRLLELRLDHALWPRVRMPAAVITWLSGRAPPGHMDCSVLPDPRPAVPPRVLVSTDLWSRLEGTLADDALRALIIAPSGAAVPTLLEGMAAATGRGLVELDLTPRRESRQGPEELLEQAARDALLTKGLLVLSIPSRVDEHESRHLEYLQAHLDALPVPVVIRADRMSPMVQRLSEGFTRFDLPELGVDELVTLWIAASPGGMRGPAGRAQALLRDILRDHRLTPSAILLAAPDAANRASAAGRPSLTRDDIVQASATQAENDLGNLATRLTTHFSFSDLILPHETHDQLREILDSAAHRQLVMDAWGFGPKYPYGSCLSVLFSGPSGTGKTMAASILAETLGRPLYRVDLSQIFDRYVGETEKNLSKIFDGAQAAHAIILFDEADALFSKRTEVKSSNDRYANLEVNFLLQRIEHHHGMVILTTNLDSSIDEAFRRRIRFTVRFPMPDVETRARLWRSMIPPQAALASNVDFLALGHDYDLPGGGIKNAVLRAAFLAAGEGQPIGTSHLERAARAECAAMGKLVRAR